MSTSETRIASERTVRADAETPRPGQPQLSENTYRTVWRWHLYAGLLVAPILIWGAVTGALYVFVDEIEAWLDPDALYVAEEGERKPFVELLETARAEARGDLLHSFSVNPDPRRTVSFFVASPHERSRSIYVNPYTAAVTGVHHIHSGFFPLVRTLHRTLYMGTVGRVLMELTCSWGIVLLLTGVYLWWPRKQSRPKGGTAGVWRIRTASTRVLLRDLHAVIGVYLAPVSIVVLLTGLFFTQVWGTGYRLALLKSGSIPRVVLDLPKTTHPENSPRLSLDRIVEIACAKSPPGLVSIDFPQEPDDTIRVTAGTVEDPSRRALFAIDPVDGTTMLHSDWQSGSPLLKLYTLAYPLHVGSIFGLPTKILATLSCLALVSSTVTGVWMWWRKRPGGSFSIPRRPVGRRVRSACIAFMVLSGIVLPLAGISFLLMASLDWVWQRRRRPASP
ncbi:PepSY-associated TM helix [Caulifigura coniformis]|uniref:PepSY-associated TM helix n=1 Tax=Caulifigura coniformis TaxID=2527983 RepID=A0A517SI13_9PLAN|nr:PepSY domain-containing protein [Caulifigura coniformis]QDT55766.1 PepSY-associated TM helix [Caulifigura coniformis]